ncbi:glycosyltransferase [Candidatus Daviesbacteria bacterium]|nr:glycosyltransferase [Candidatus Daviesbacteria bacterium]
MKIGFFTDTYAPQLNGVATSVKYFAKILRERGHQVYIIAPKIKGYTDSEEDIFRIPSVRLWPTVPDSVRLPLLTPDRVWLKIFKIDYDIIHAHGNGLFSLLAYTVAKQKKIPFILTFHTLIREYRHYFFNGKVLTPQMMDAGLKIFGNVCNAVTTPSYKMREELIKMGVEKPISVIPNFVDLAKFNISKKGYLHKNYHIPKDCPILLSVGRLGKEKNFEFIIKMFAALSKKEDKSYLAIVGEGFELKNLQALAKKLGVLKRVVFTGGIVNDKMPYVYQDADIFVFASTSEVHPMVSIEAAASGLPLVLVNDGAFEKEIVDSKNGYSIPLKVELFLEKLLALIKDKKLRKQMGKNSLKVIKDNYQEDVLINQLLNLYRTTIKTIHPRKTPQFLSP